MRHIDTRRSRSTGSPPRRRRSATRSSSPKGERLRPERLRIERIDADQHIAEVRYCFGGEPPREEFRRRGGRSGQYMEASIARPSWAGGLRASESSGYPRRQLRITIDGRRVRAETAIERARRHGLVSRRSAAVPRSCAAGSAARCQSPRPTGHASSRRLPERAVSEGLGVHRPQPPGPGQRRAPVPLREGQPPARSTPGSSSTATRRTGSGSPRRASASWSTAPPEHLLLMLNCVELISSQFDHYIVHPIDTQRFGRGAGGSRSSSTESRRTTCRVG